MIKDALRWGLISGVLMAVLFSISFVVWPLDNPENYAASEVAGYAGMVISLGVIYLAIAAHFRDKPDAGVWPRVLLGLGVAFVSGVVFGLFDAGYVSLFDPGFIDRYYDYALSQMPQQSGPEYDAAVAEMEAQRDLFGNMPMLAVVMAATVWGIGIPITILAALIHTFLSRRRAA